MTGRTEGISNPLKYMAVRLGERLFACDLNWSSVLPLPGGANGIENVHIKGIVELHESTYYLINLEHIASSWLERKDPARSGISVSAGDMKI